MAMFSTPKKTSRLSRSLGEPSRVVSRLREQSPGGHSVGSVEEASQPASGLRGRTGSECAGERAIFGSAAVSRASSRPRTLRHDSRDPRPVGERAFAQVCARNVVEFIGARGYGKTVSYEKFFKDPTTKEFYDIFKFLVLQLDPCLEMDGPIEQEVPQIMRRLKYPVEINKSKLQAISGPNTWPQLLAALDYLVVLISLHDEWILPVATCETNPFQQEDRDHEMLRSLHDNYWKYLNGQGGKDHGERLKQLYIERINAVKEEMRRMRDHYARDGEVLTALRGEHERLLQLRAEPALNDKECASIRAVLLAHEGNVQMYESEEEATEKELPAVEFETKEMQARIRQLQEQVQSQAYSKKDIERLKCEGNHLRKMLEDLSEDGEKADHAVWELTMKESGRVEAVGRLVRRINDALELAGHTVACSEGLGGSLYVRVDLTEPTDALSTLDFHDERDHIGKTTRVKLTASQVEEATLQEVLQEQRALQEELAMKEHNIFRCRQRAEQLEKIREDSRTWTAVKLEDAQRTAEETEDALHEASRSQVGPSIRDCAEVDELRLTLKMLRTEGAEELTQLREQVRHDAERSVEHRRAVHQELQAFANDMDQFAKSVIEEALAATSRAHLGGS